MTTFPWAGRLLPAALTRAASIRVLPASLRRVVLDDVPAGWERAAFDDTVDDDPFGWLGFEPGDRTDEPRWHWPRPARWPVSVPAPRVRTRTA